MLVLLLGVVPLCAQQDQPQRDRLHLVLAGDSTVTDDSGWGTGFVACVADGVRCTNLARGGRSSSSFREEGLWQQALDLKPDWILIQFGHNDEPGHPGKENQPEAGYRANLERYVDEAWAAGIQPLLVTPLSRRQWGKTDFDRDRIVSSLAPYAEVVRDIAATKGVPLIDLHNRSREVYQSLGSTGCELISPKKENGNWDNTHLNQPGAVLFGSLMAMDCRSYVPGLGNFFPTSKLMELQKTHRPPSLGGRVDRRPLYAKEQLTSQGTSTLVVARDGSGDFRTIQEAVRRFLQTTQIALNSASSRASTWGRF